VQLVREIQDLPYLVAIQLQPRETRSPEPRKFLAVRGQHDLPSVHLGIQYRPTFLNLNGNYTGVPVFVHPCTLNPGVRFYFSLQLFVVKGEQAGVIWNGVCDLGFGVHAGAFDPGALDWEEEVGDEEDGEGSSDGDGRREQDRAEWSF
jgi:hypothetical protein